MKPGGNVVIRLLRLQLLGGLPALVLALSLLVGAQGSPWLGWTLALVVVLCWVACTMAVFSLVDYQLRTLSNLIAALREGDYSFQARGEQSRDALSEVIGELNGLAKALREQRFSDVEATSLLRKVMAEIDVAVFAFDSGSCLRLVNNTGELLLGEKNQALYGRPASDFGLAECLDGAPARTMALGFPGGGGRWDVRRGGFRQHGRPHTLLVLSDVSRTLRTEELVAWKRLIRVIGHELRNSLAPIKSLAGSLAQLVAQEPLAEDWREDLSRGLQVIGSRAEALNRFMGAYASFAKMPAPRMRSTSAEGLVQRVARLESRLPVRIIAAPDLTITADPDQLEQALINLLGNAVDASLETGGEVSMGWTQDGTWLDLWVRDSGAGLADTGNLFVPFFTTKPGGSGIGLVLCMQVAEGHGGRVTLENRRATPGCEAILRIPNILPAPS